MGTGSVTAFFPPIYVKRDVPTPLAAALATAIRTALQWSKAQPVGPRNLLGDAGHRLSWAAYGSRYDRFLREMIHTQK